MTSPQARARKVSRAGCACRNGRGTAKQEHASREAALDWMLAQRRTGRIYQCPTSDRWHVSSQMEPPR